MKARFYRFVSSEFTIKTYFKVRRTRYKIWIDNEWYRGAFTWERLTRGREAQLREVSDLEVILMLGPEALQ